MRVLSSHRYWFLIVASSFLIFCVSCASTSSISPTTPPTPSVTSPLIIYKGQPGTLIQPFYALSRSPDGTRIVSGGDNQTAQVWNAATGKTLLAYSGHGDSVWG